MTVDTFGLGHVGFSVSNLDKSITFYRLLPQCEPVLRRYYPEPTPAHCPTEDRKVNPTSEPKEVVL
jgi:catechol 2,3-dioxygenase-like lactoylglutathione lyase family enzyme